MSSPSFFATPSPTVAPSEMEEARTLYELSPLSFPVTAPQLGHIPLPPISLPNEFDFMPPSPPLTETGSVRSVQRPLSPVGEMVEESSLGLVGVIHSHPFSDHGVVLSRRPSVDSLVLATTRTPPPVYYPPPSVDNYTVVQPPPAYQPIQLREAHARPRTSARGGVIPIIQMMLMPTIFLVLTTVLLFRTDPSKPIVLPGWVPLAVLVISAVLQAVAACLKASRTALPDPPVDFHDHQFDNRQRPWARLLNVYSIVFVAAAFTLLVVGAGILVLAHTS